MRPGTRSARPGVEASYDAYLRGHAGLAQLRVDSLGRPRSPLVPKRRAGAGRVDQAHARRRASARRRAGARLRDRQGAATTGSGRRTAARSSRSNPRDGSILAMASNPTYEPKLYTGHVSSGRSRTPASPPRAAERRTTRRSNRAISGLYPAGSTFKPVTALAALADAHHLARASRCPAPGRTRSTRRTARARSTASSTTGTSSSTRSMTLPTALAASCDTFFYQLGSTSTSCRRARAIRSRPGPRSSASAARPASTSAPESAGLLPTPEWRKRTFTPKTDPGNWQIDSLWKPGDSIQLTIGQKDLLVTPLQMARFYALIANGGKLVRPHIVQDVEEGGGNARSPARIVHRFTAPAPQPVGLDPTELAAVQDGLSRRPTPRYGTSTRRLRQLPGRDRRQDRDGREGDPGHSFGSVRPVVVVRLRACRHGRDPRARRLRADRERRPRRRRGGARGAEGLREVLPPARGHQPGPVHSD